ncbi:MAG: single-stranded DNA-binding protein [Bacilli bacterium]|nr:single-stranded DNA-binding protein [Bacilli bacterium]MBR3161281.1 single-stranded DNA-binding protein [Bacilli bacterium]
MLKEYINSFSLVGNISYIGDIQEQKNGTKYRYFQLAQNNKYKDKDGNLVDEPSFINIKLFESQFKNFEKVLEVGKYLNIFGKIKVFKDSDNKNNIILIANNYRDLNKQKQYTEIFDYDWLNEGDDREESNDYGL